MFSLCCEITVLLIREEDYFSSEAQVTVVSSTHHYLEIALVREAREQRRKEEKNGGFPSCLEGQESLPASTARTQRIYGFAPFVYIHCLLPGVCLPGVQAGGFWRKKWGNHHRFGDELFSSLPIRVLSFYFPELSHSGFICSVQVLQLPPVRQDGEHFLHLTHSRYPLCVVLNTTFGIVF